MGTTVLDAGASRAGLHLYAQCMPGHPGGVTLLVINTSRTSADSVAIPMAADRYTLTALSLDATQVQLNGHPLELEVDDELPPLQGTNESAGQVQLPPASISFLAIAGAGNGSCK